jgi:hypothetical protein
MSSEYSLTLVWSGMAFNADSTLSSVINIYLLDKEIDICTKGTLSISQILSYICPCVRLECICWNVASVLTELFVEFRFSEPKDSGYKNDVFIYIYVCVALCDEGNE